jgi:four helix bundle protein
MARYDNIEIFHSAYTLVLDVYKITKNFKREYKYTLGEKIKIAAHELLNSIMIVNSLPDKEKLQRFLEIDFKKENLRIHLRLAYDLNTISAGQLKAANEKIEEVGRQLGGWQKWIASHSK